MPAFGIAAEPVENIRNTNSHIRLDVASSRSRKTPPKNGRKNFSIMTSEKPRWRSNSRVFVSGWLNSSDKEGWVVLFRKLPILSLSLRKPPRKMPSRPGAAGVSTDPKVDGIFRRYELRLLAQSCTTPRLRNPKLSRLRGRLLEKLEIRGLKETPGPHRFAPARRFCHLLRRYGKKSVAS